MWINEIYQFYSLRRENREEFFGKLRARHGAASVFYDNDRFTYWRYGLA
jgi:hypothetical protein